MMFALVKFIIRVFLLFVFRIKIVGKKNIISGKGAILAGNHKSNWDPLLVALGAPKNIAFMAKSELFKFKPFGFILKKLGAFPVHRGKGDIGAIKTALSILKAERTMVMFPEGKRVSEGERVDVKPGVTMLATRARVPVVPVLISGKYRWMGKITVTYGEPIYFDEYYDEKLSMEKLQELANSVMDKIYSLDSTAEALK